jgi:hypothetical protein
MRPACRLLTVTLIAASLAFWLGQLYGMVFRDQDATVAVVNNSVVLLLPLPFCTWAQGSAASSR